MATIFHEGRKILRSEIGNHNYAEIADLLFFRIQISKYKDNNGNTFFLLPNIEYLVEETGIKKRTCERALTELVKNGFISKTKTRCFDGAVRLKIFITNKFKGLMNYISSLTKNTSSKKADNNNFIEEDVHDNVAESDFATEAESIIKEEEIKDNNINNSNEKIDYMKNVNNVNFVFSLDSHETYKFTEKLADNNKIDCTDLLIALVDLEESGLYSDRNSLIDDAIAIVKRNYGGIDILPKKYLFNSYKAMQIAENDRESKLTAKQIIAIRQMLNYLHKKGKAIISNVKEVFSWIEFQITNPSYQLEGLGFKHCLNVIRNLLCDNGKRQYSKPIGFTPLSMNNYNGNKLDF